MSVISFFQGLHLFSIWSGQDCTIKQVHTIVYFLSMVLIKWALKSVGSCFKKDMDKLPLRSQNIQKRKFRNLRINACKWKFFHNYIQWAHLNSPLWLLLPFWQSWPQPQPEIYLWRLEAATPSTTPTSVSAAVRLSTMAALATPGKELGILLAITNSVKIGTIHTLMIVLSTAKLIARPIAFPSALEAMETKDFTAKGHLPTSTMSPKTQVHPTNLCAFLTSRATSAICPPTCWTQFRLSAALIPPQPRSLILLTILLLDMIVASTQDLPLTSSLM